MTELYFVRHAQASFRSSNYDRLSDLGVRQSEILGNYLAAVGLSFDAFYSGAMERQQTSALSVLSRLFSGSEKPQLRIAPEFNEYDAHTIIRSLAPVMTAEDTSMAQAFETIFTDGQSLKRVFEGAMLRWVSAGNRIPGVESWEEFKNRVAAGVKRVIQGVGRHGRIVVFTSGGAICALMQMALRLADDETIRLALQIRNASVSTFRHNGQRPDLVCFNSIAHLELANDPELITYR